MAALTFGKRERIRKRSEIDRVFNEGRRFSCKGMRLHFISNGLDCNRVVFITVRSYPGAVQRNRARRVLRECWRLLKPEVHTGYDVVVVIYPGVDDYPVRLSQLRHMLTSAGLLVPRL